MTADGPRVLLDDLFKLDVAYAGFNALKTLGDPRDSRFSVVDVGPLTVTSDRARTSTYYNRIVGLSPATLRWLDDALKLFDDADRGPRIDVVIEDMDALDTPLRKRGFVAGDELLWLESGPSRITPSVPVRRLSPTDADRILPLLEHQGPVDPDLWQRRRHHHGTERFRAFVVEAEGEVVSMATTFVVDRGAILGNAYTREGSRGRGYQGALIAARLADATRLGLECVLTDVEPETVSARNCEKHGFTPNVHLCLWERAG